MDKTKRNVVRFGIVSYLTDISSEMILGVFSVFFTTILGGSTRLLGILEGLADFSASALDYFAGYIGDKTGQHKNVSVSGYSLSALSKIMLATVQSVGGAFAFRIIDRLGKSIRGSPRDAWLATVVQEENRGFAYALHKTFDKLGAITGALIAYYLLITLGSGLSTYKLLFLLATIPAVLSVVILWRIPRNKVEPATREGIFVAYKTFSSKFKRYVKCGAIFSLAYFSFSFFLLKAYDVGFTVAQVALLYALMSFAFVLVAVLIGRLGDLVGRRLIIGLSYLLFCLTCLGFAFATTKTEIIILFCVFGVFLSIDESQTKAFITDIEHVKRGSAIGFYNFILAFGYVVASIVAGFLWTWNPLYAFVYSAIISGIAFINYIFRMDYVQ